MKFIVQGNKNSKISTENEAISPVDEVTISRRKVNFGCQIFHDFPGKLISCSRPNFTAKLCSKNSHYS